MNLRIAGISLFYGGFAGVISAFTLMLMLGLQHLIWSRETGPLFIFTTIMIGGILIAGLNHRHNLASLTEAIAEATHPAPLIAKKTALLAVSAIIAVAFGASIGPEAGLVAVVAQLSILVSGKIAQNQQENQLIGSTGNSAVLASVYGSPPGAVSFEDDTISPHKLPQFVAAISGFLCFMATLKLSGSAHHPLELPISPRGDLSVWWQAIPASVFGCAIAALFMWLHHKLDVIASKNPRPWVSTIVGSLVLAGFLAVVPILRFSGHAELPELLSAIEQSSWLILLGIAVLKVVVTAVSLSSGWTGGEFFPLSFAGAAAGALALAAFPGADVGTVMTAGMVAATTIAIRKPLAVVLIMVFMLPGTAIGPLLIASGIATMVSKLRSGMKISSH